MNLDNYLVWMHSNKVKHGCVLGTLTGVENILDLNEGISFTGRFPSDASYSLHPDFPNHLVLTDNLLNSDGLIVVSARLKDKIQQIDLQCVEFHSVTIRDHKGKIFSQEYHILHPVEPVDCLNSEASNASASLILPEMIDSVERLVIYSECVPANRALFRIARFPEPTLIRRDLAAEFDKTGFTGFRWLELSSYPEL